MRRPQRKRRNNPRNSNNDSSKCHESFNSRSDTFVINHQNIKQLQSMKRKSEKSHEEKAEDYVDFEPKLTRSKAKKLLQQQPNIVWPITPLKKITQSDLDFINEELPEESDDEEYKPSLDDLQDQSEEESGRQSVVSTVSHSSALEISVSQYLENFDDHLLENDSIRCPSDNLFKVPEENIGQRTRSKLCLSDTPLEAIEKAFVPPDITTDMYDFKCDNEDWENFLKEFMQPLSNDLDDDDEADPEYSALADEEEMYKEELRKDRAVKISRKELRKLMAELFECPDELSSDEEEEKRVKIEITNKVNSEIEEKAQMKEEEKREKENTALMTKTQILLLEQQLRQHVQLTTQHFLQTCEHPMYGIYAKDCKIILATLLELSKIKTDCNSVYNIYNLESAFNLVENWEKYLLSKDGPAVKEHMENEIEKAKKAKKKNNYHRITFHPALLKLMSESSVFLYSLMLPPHGFRCDGPLKMEFVPPEDCLIAIGLEEFSQYLKKNPRWFNRLKQTEKAACELLCDYLMPVKKPSQVIRRIRQVKGVESNPISYYRQHRQAPNTIHFVIPFNEYLKKPPCERPKEILPGIFREFIYPGNVDDENKENDHG